MKDIEDEVRQYLEARGWDNLRPGDLAKSISIEAAELLELFQWASPSLSEVKEDQEKLSRIRKELADVLIYCLDMSVLLGLDTAAIVREKLAFIQEKYPADLFKNRAQGTEPGSEDEYWKIKRTYREQGIE